MSKFIAIVNAVICLGLGGFSLFMGTHVLFNEDLDILARILFTVLFAALAAWFIFPAWKDFKSGSKKE